MEFRQGQEPNLSSKQGGRQTRSYQLSSGCHQEPVRHIEKYLRVGDVSDLPHVLGKWFTNTHKVFFLIHLRFPRDGPLHL